MIDKEIIKFANILDKVLTVIRVILLCSLGLTALALVVGIIAYLFGLEDIILELIPLTYTYGPINFNVPMSDATGIVFGFFASVSIFSMMFVLLLSVNSLKKILFSVKQKQPFSEDVCCHITRIAILSLLAFGISSIVDVIKYTYSYQALEQTLSQIESIKSVGLFPTLKLTPLLLSAFLFFLAKIFRYGASLQKEVDETL